MEESVSGFSERGTWSDIVEHGERITRALRDLTGDEVDIDESALEEWDEWRPKHDERLDEDVNRKTAEQASVGEGAGEKAGKDPDEDIQQAGEELAESYERLDDPDEAVGKAADSVGYIARAADSAGRKAIRRVEGAVYRNVMTRIAPYYFDNELVSANVSRVGRSDGADYELEVDVNDDDLKIRVSNQLADYESGVDRWHVDTPKETESAVAAEGVEPPAEGTEGRSHPDTN
ncbi:hypothetical protein BRC89_02890 [Halobacteriales archaeon QS_4_70_19]|nr:MAG: hypothetical protein BRC89_02890 [Halobacteriales archaeon QS_4_70_19]